MVPSVILNQLDNQVGIVDPGGERLAIIGASSAGPKTVGTYARRSDIVSTYGVGPLVQAACWALELTGKPVVLCRTDDTTLGTYGTLTTVKTGTSTWTAGASEPYDDYEVEIVVTTGATVGTTGGAYTYSLDGGRTVSAPQALGTATSIVITEANVTVALQNAATIVAGDRTSFRTGAPCASTAERAATLELLRTTSNAWRICLIEGPVVAADVAAIATAATAMETVGKARTFVASFRIPNIGESEATYKTAFDTAFGASVLNRLVLCAGAAELQSPIDQRRYTRRIAMDAAAALVAVRPGQDIAEVGLGPRPASVRILDDNLNPKHHDELYSPGLDDSRACTYRTWAGRTGVYFTNAPLLSATGSDFKYAQHIRTMNVLRETVRSVLEVFCSADVLVDPRTGYILEQEASAIDEVVNQALEAVLVNTRDASAAEFQLSRTDNILSTFKLRGAARLTPLAYPKTFEIDVGFYNPALRVRPAEEV